MSNISVLNIFNLLGSFISDINWFTLHWKSFVDEVISKNNIPEENRYFIEGIYRDKISTVTNNFEMFGIMANAYIKEYNDQIPEELKEVGWAKMKEEWVKQFLLENFSLMSLN